MKDRIVAFFTDVVKEMKKVTWPKKRELRDTTAMVIIFCLLSSLFVWGVDAVVNGLLNALYSAGR